MSAARVLVVEDEVRLAQIVGRYLEHDGFTVRLVHDGAQALMDAATFRPDVVVLDVMLPGADGFEVCRALRQTSDCYIVMLTAREAERDKLAALALGADDYVVKPCSPREILARVRAMLRRPRIETPGPVWPAVAIGPLWIDVEARRVEVNGQALDLTRTEFDLLHALAARPAAALTRSELIRAVWGPGWFGDEHVVDVHVANLRRKLSATPAGAGLIRTVRGIGYGLEDAS
ncbi:MAG: response regulator transcription factor [Actinobacteria bacterium]|nr:response regulator transcription factor [Actinomycetota bacterium]